MDKNEKELVAVVGDRDHLVAVTAEDGLVTLTLGMVMLDETAPYEERMHLTAVLNLGPDEAIDLAAAIATAAAASEDVVE